MLPDVPRCFKIRLTLVYFIKMGKFCNINAKIFYFDCKKIWKIWILNPLWNVARCSKVFWNSVNPLLFYKNVNVRVILNSIHLATVVQMFSYYFCYYWTGIYPNFPFGFVFWQHVIGEMWGNVHTAKSTKMF